ncbi:MAG TPA: 1,4-alpha-glucan branching protein GlgB [Vicinamibacterales bacterium]|jgi:1,4-alpha-glucan branching enzyme|nr:1,4-alpha-glucan branching protein GlgB [Vicinamibacterales bacterium]
MTPESAAGPIRIVSDYEAYLFGEGHWLRAWEKMGARPAVEGGVAGYSVVVWAPNARGVSIVGDFNGWDGRRHPLAPLGPSGLWETFVPGLGAGELYKIEIQPRHGPPLTKADPFALFAERPPRTASITADFGRHVWTDAAWMAARAARAPLDVPMAIYEVHAGSWRRRADEGNRPLSWRELAAELVPYVKDLGFTHIELLPVMEHPFDGSWGYQVTGYFAPTSRYGTPDDFRAFIDACHGAGLGVLLDWVPGHFPKDAHGLAWFDGTALFEHADPRQGEHRDWGTLIFNYGRHEVRNFLLTNALYWLESFHVDGLRVDAVASMLYLDYSREAGEWVPNQYGGRENLEAIDFLRELNTLTHGQHPGTVMVAEESTAFPAVSRPTWVGGLGFTFKWNMGWMHDILTYVEKDPVFRRWEHQHLTFSMLYAFNENFILPFSHDEVVHGKGSMLSKAPGDVWQKFATLRLLYTFMSAHPGKLLLFMGDEIGEWREWDHDGSLDWGALADPMHAGLQRCVADLNRLYQAEPALYEVDFEPGGFEWIDCNDHESSVVSFLRRARDPEDFIVAVLNWTPVVRTAYRVGVPEPGFYRELVNSDAAIYGGGNVGNAGGVETEPVAAHGHAQSIVLTLPPLAGLLLRRDRPSPESRPTPDR